MPAYGILRPQQCFPGAADFLHCGPDEPQRYEQGYEPMVLVSYRLDNHISILQTKFSAREGHEARRVGS